MLVHRTDINEYCVETILEGNVVSVIMSELHIDVARDDYEFKTVKEFGEALMMAHELHESNVIFFIEEVLLTERFIRV